MQIVILPGAEVELDAIASAHDRARVVFEIAAQLKYEPLVETKRRKPLGGALAPSWELRIGKYRAFYIVVGQKVTVFRVVDKGRKTTKEVIE